MSNKTAQEPQPDIPVWITTYSDMITLLMTFFVLLQSMANVQDAALVGKGRESFVKHIRTYGLGVMPGWPLYSGLGQDKLRHKTNTDDPNALRTIDAEREMRRRAFARIQQSMVTLPGQCEVKRTEFMVVNVRFALGQSRIEKDSKKALDEFAADLSLIVRPHDRIYVLGVGDGLADLRQQWIISAQRAAAVADYLAGWWRNSQASACPPIYAWGAGPARGWAGRQGGKDVQLLVAVVKPGI